MAIVLTRNTPASASLVLSKNALWLDAGIPFGPTLTYKRKANQCPPGARSAVRLALMATEPEGTGGGKGLKGGPCAEIIIAGSASTHEQAIRITLKGGIIQFSLPQGLIVVW